MEYKVLPWVLRQERDDIQVIQKRWQPKDLLFLAQAKETLRDLDRRYSFLNTAQDELLTLDRGSLYIKLLSRMRLLLRQAHFTWRGDQLSFLRAVSRFYTDYGAVLRLLKEDSLRGKLPSE